MENNMTEKYLSIDAKTLGNIQETKVDPKANIDFTFGRGDMFQSNLRITSPPKPPKCSACNDTKTIRLPRVLSDSGYERLKRVAEVLFGPAKDELGFPIPKNILNIDKWTRDPELPCNYCCKDEDKEAFQKVWDIYEGKDDADAE